MSKFNNKMRKLTLSLAMLLIFQSCIQRDGNSNNKNLKKYTITIYQDTFDHTTKEFKPNNLADSMQADNDTVAYLVALNKFYNQKIAERANYNFGQPKSFLIVDKSGIDLKVKLSEKIVTGLRNQVENTPNVKKT